MKNKLRNICLIIVIILFIATVTLIFFGKKKLNEIESEAKQVQKFLLFNGYKNSITNRDIRLPKHVLDKLILRGDKNFYSDNVLIENGSSHELGIFSRKATLKGIYESDIHFYGLVLTLEKGAIIKGNIYGRGYLFKKRGKVEGINNCKIY